MLKSNHKPGQSCKKYLGLGRKETFSGLLEYDCYLKTIKIPHLKSTCGMRVNSFSSTRLTEIHNEKKEFLLKCMLYLVS